MANTVFQGRCVRLQPAAQLVGIARLASQGAVLDEKQRVEYRTLPTRRWLNRCGSKRVPFTWTINPYRGCEYGCKYCYARFTHEFLELHEPDSFETEIYAKDFDCLSFRRELSSLRPGHVLGLGTATDPYQPAERKYGRTRQVLEALTGVRQISLFVTTKSDLVARDADLLAELSRENQVRVSVTVTTLNTNLARQLEPFAPRPDLRLKAVAALAGRGVPAGVLGSPILPLLTDGEENLLGVATAAKEAGGAYFSAGVLFLKPEAQRVFFPFLESAYPEYVLRYRKAYGTRAFLGNAYTEAMRRRVEKVRNTVGLNVRDPVFEQDRPAQPGNLQLHLF